MSLTMRKLFAGNDLEAGSSRQVDGKEKGTAVARRVVVREYAHHHIAGKPGVRSDFTETLYWNPHAASPTPTAGRRSASISPTP